MPDSIEFLVIRHAKTEADIPYTKDKSGIHIQDPKKCLIKGCSDNSQLYRLSDEGILYAHETALALLKHYKKGERVRLFHSPLTRTTEFEEILRTVLKNVTHTPIEEFRERWFGSIDGQPIDEFERVVLETSIYPTYSLALTYADDFNQFEKQMGLDVQGGETFKDTFRRVYRGMQNVVNQCFTSHYTPLSDYVPIVGHQIEGVFALACLRLIGKSQEEVEQIIKNIKTQEDKERLVPYYHLCPARFYRVRFIAYKDRLWAEVQEHNDWHHLALLEAKITNLETGEVKLQEDDLERVDKVRKLLTRWYAQRELPVNPSLEIQPFYMYSPEATRSIEIASPLKLAGLIKNNNEIPDTYVENQMGKRENINQIPDWIKNVFGYDDLAENLRNLNESLIWGKAPIDSIRLEISGIIEDYTSLPKGN